MGSAGAGRGQYRKGYVFEARLVCIVVTGSCLLMRALPGFHRINTYPFIHLGLTHTVLNILALTPLLERFESEYGSLTTLALFTGRKSMVLAGGRRKGVDMGRKWVAPAIRMLTRLFSPFYWPGGALHHH
jgi:membrane associated rhomboid family serine protease